MTLIDFLLARIAEDEQNAQWAAESLTPRGESWDVWYPWQAHSRPVGNTKRPPDTRTSRYMAPSPARVLAECEAKRHVINLHSEAVSSDLRAGADWAYGEVLRRLALPYADHPDFDPAWRP